MHYDPAVVERVLEASGLVPCSSEGGIVATLRTDAEAFASYDLVVRPQVLTCLVAIRYRRKLRDGAVEYSALAAKAEELGTLFADFSNGYAVSWGYEDSSESANVECYTYVREDETLHEAIERLKIYAALFYHPLQSVGQRVH